jgi:hypothetical protein
VNAGRRYRTAQIQEPAWARAKFGPDIHAQIEKVLYSVPRRYIGKTADVRITSSMVQFLIGGQLVKSHPCKIRGKQTAAATTRRGGARAAHLWTRPLQRPTAPGTRSTCGDGGHAYSGQL